MHSNKVHNMNAASASWLASNINANAKRRFLTKLANPKTSPSGDYNFQNLDKQVEELKEEKSSASLESEKTDSDGDSDLDENDPLTIEIKEMVLEELAKPQSRILTLNLGVSGLQYVFDSKQPWYIKIFWLSTIISCFSVCGYQVLDRVKLYLRYPMSAEIEVLQNHTILFPAILACPVETEKLAEINKLYKKKYTEEAKTFKTCDALTLAHLIGFEYEGKNLTAEEVWNLTDPYEQKYFTKFLFRDLILKQDTAYITDERVVMFSGVCIRFDMNQYVEFHGIASQIKIVSETVKKNKCNRYGFKIMVMDTFDFLNLKDFFPVTSGTKAGFTILVKQYQAIDVPNSPCQSSESHRRCYQHCTQGLIDREISCKLPYMPLSGKPMCETSKDALKTQYIAEKILKYANITHSCGCVKKCLRVMYSMLPKTYSFDSYETDVTIYYASNYFEIVRESYSYDWMALLCDIGGNLGLYLGLSILTAFEVGQSFYDTYKRVKAQKLAALSKQKQLERRSVDNGKHNDQLSTTYGHYGNMNLGFTRRPELKNRCNSPPRTNVF